MAKRTTTSRTGFASPTEYRGSAPTVELSTITEDIIDPHRDAVEAARVSQLCAKAAGKRLIEIRRGLGQLV